MNRLYVIESMMTLTGGAADHRMPAGPTETTTLALALAGAILAKLGGGVRVPQVDAGAPLYTVHAEAPGELAYSLDYVAANQDIIQVTEA